MAPLTRTGKTFKGDFFNKSFGRAYGVEEPANSAAVGVIINESF